MKTQKKSQRTKVYYMPKDKNNPREKIIHTLSKEEIDFSLFHTFSPQNEILESN